MTLTSLMNTDTGYGITVCTDTEEISQFSDEILNVCSYVFVTENDARALFFRDE